MVTPALVSTETTPHYDADAERYVARFDPSAPQALLPTVRATIAEATGCDRATVPPLHRSIDVAELASVPSTAPNGQTTDGVDDPVVFEAAGCRVRVAADGRVTVRSLDPE